MNNIMKYFMTMNNVMKYLMATKHIMKYVMTCFMTMTNLMENLMKSYMKSSMCSFIRVCWMFVWKLAEIISLNILLKFYDELFHEILK